ncbi:MAG: YbaK/EbsC family protein [Nitrospirae bacterium]|nr:YbaK/EbsC family protein [Nitrospirota bacterium]
MVERMENMLINNRVSFKTYKHPEAFTAQEIAASLHIPGKELAKVVMVKASKRFIMTVLPASWMVDINRLKEIVHEKDLMLASEEEFKMLFPDCEAGAEPPMGNLYNIDTYVDRSLTDDDHIFFNAGNHYETVEISYKDYARLVHPMIAEFAIHH